MGLKALPWLKIYTWILGWCFSTVGPLLIKGNSWGRRVNTDKERLRRAAHDLSSALISCCKYNSTDTSNVRDSSKFLSCWLVLWQRWVSVFYLCLHSFVLVSSKWDKPRRKRWMRVKKSNYSSTSMMERGGRRHCWDFCHANCRHRLPAKGNQLFLRTY